MERMNYQAWFIERRIMIYEHPHPGEFLQDLVFEPLNLLVKEAAERLVVSEEMLSQIVNGTAPINPVLALRLEQVGVSTARFWMNLQAHYDLWLAMQHKQPTVRALS